MKEIREAVELPLTHMNMYKAIGIDPPRNHSQKFPKKQISPLNAQFSQKIGIE